MNLNLLQQIMDVPKMRKYASPKITRAGLTTNPVENYSFTGGTVFSNDNLVKHGNSFFIGGDTQTYEFDFGLKVAGSVAECPLKVYSVGSAGIQSPTVLSSYEIAIQTDIDKIKTQENNALTKTTYANYIEQMMVELDLTPLCNSLFSGSNSALKSALKAINVDVWAQGSGASGGVLTNGVSTYAWNGSSWVYKTDNNTGSINKINQAIPQATATYYVNSSNKLYILIASQYASDGTIASQVQLDYINIKVDLARTADTVSPISVSLPKYFACVGGFSPSWIAPISNVITLFSIFKDANNFYKLVFSSNNFYISKKVNGTQYETTQNIYNSKFQVVKFVFYQSNSELGLYLLLNNGTVVKKVLANSLNFSGLSQLYLLIDNTNTQQSNAFAESFHLVDLQKIGKSNGFTDAEATAILQGVLPNLLGIQNPLVTDKILPNNRYSLTGTADIYYNNIKTRSVSADFTTNNYENKIVLGTNAICRRKD